MPRFSALLLLSWGLLAAAFGQVVAFENVTVLPMDRDRVLERQTVIVRDGRIAQIGPAAQVKAPAGAERIAAAGKYLLPGLAEMHGHFPPPNSADALVEQVLFLYVANGITTVRAMQGSPAALERRAAVAAGRLLGPRFYVAGPPLSGASAKTADLGQKMVREQKAAGYDLLKIQEGLSPEVYDAIARTAREVQIDFAGHVPNEVGVRRAIAARQRSIDHLDNYLDALEADDSPAKGASAAERARWVPFHADERKIAELAKLTREAGVWNIPTMALWDVFHSDATGDQLRDTLAEVRFMPATLVADWTRRKNAMLRPPDNVFMGFEVGTKSALRVMELRRKMLKGLRDFGAKIALGTDSPQVFSVPGFSIHREMAAMVSAGFTPFEVLQSGTRNVAEYFGTLGESGTIETGKRADLILLEANPLRDVGNVQKRAGVMVRGRWLPEREIQDRLEKVAAASAKM